MNVAIFGATGGTGRQVVEQALLAGHTVRVLVRAPGKAALPRIVQIVRGDVLDAEAVAQTVESADVVLSSLGAKLIATFTRRGRILATGMTHIVDAMRAHEVRRLVAVSTYGAGDSWP
ncbi:MAG: NAD(P)-dependent oxidoreductase, partial [Solimonas sp.]